ncbi:putative pectin lyase F-1 [Ilyonectria destructans]|nr:putative pectin lyase F-1 [Ilyonectria destructans]
MQATTITYDKAGTTNLVVGSNKSILGLGNTGVIQGKGLRLPPTSKNVIIQNVHITDLNPVSVWGSDALQLEGDDGVWVDHCTFSKIGPMMVVTHFAATRLTISYTELSGHDVSGRAPKLGADDVSTIVQASNNYFANCKGHAFDVYPGTTALLDGNLFEAVTTPMTAGSEKVSSVYTVPDSGSISACASSLGRSCVANSLSGSGKWPSLKSTSALSTLNGVRGSLVAPIQAASVKTTVYGEAGIGRV